MWTTVFKSPVTLTLNPFLPQTLEDSVPTFFPSVLKDMQLKFQKCQDIAITGAKSCQEAALCIYFNKLKPELFFPGVSLGFS